MTISFRPHHFLCAYCFQGKGYSGEFISNFSEIMQQLNAEAGDATLIEVVPHTDSICSPCPHKLDKLCTSQEKIMRLDAAHAAVLGISPGEKMTWGEAKLRILEKMTLEKFHEACTGCEWKAYGICEKKISSSRKIFVHTT